MGNIDEFPEQITVEERFVRHVRQYLACKRNLRQYTFTNLNKTAPDPVYERKLILASKTESESAQQISEKYIDEALASRDKLNFINGRDEHLYTALHWASLYGDLELVQRLLNLGAKPQAWAWRGITPLHLAVEAMQFSADNDEVIRQRREEVSKVITVLIEALKQAWKTDFGETLLKNKYINAADAWGNTPLHVAMGNRRRGVIKLLLKGGADVHARNNDGLRPLQYAFAQLAAARRESSATIVNGERNLAVRKWLEQVEQRRVAQDVYIASENDSSETLRDSVAEFEKFGVKIVNSDRVKVTLDKDQENGDTLLHLAAAAGDFATLDLLIKQKVSPLILNNLNESAIFSAIRHNQIHTVEYLLNQGVDYCTSASRDFHGRTPFEFAVELGLEKIVRCMLEKNKSEMIDGYDRTKRALIHMRPMHGGTWLHAAIRYAHLNLVKLFIYYNVSTTKCDGSGRTALGLALHCGHSEIAEYLHYKRLNVYVRDNQLGICSLNAAKLKLWKIVTGCINEELRCLPQPLTTTDEFDNSVLFYLVKARKTDIIKQLKGKVGFGPKNRAEETLVHWAALYADRDTLAELFAGMNEIELKQNRDARDCNGKTPIMVAVGAGNLQVAEYLVERGALVQETDKRGDSLWHHAAAVSVAALDFVSRLKITPQKFNTNRDSALHIAAATGQPELIQKCIELGDDPNHQNYQNHTPMHYFIIYGLVALDRDGENYSEKAITDIGALWLNSKINDLYVTLESARIDSKINSLKTIQDLIDYLAATKHYLLKQYKAEADSDEEGKEIAKQTPINCIDTSIAEIASNIIDNLVCSGLKLLLQNNANADLYDEKRKIPLHYAVLRSNKTAVKLLIAHTKNIAKFDAQNQTPLWCAIKDGRYYHAEELWGLAKDAQEAHGSRDHLQYIYEGIFTHLLHTNYIDEARNIAVVMQEKFGAIRPELLSQELCGAIEYRDQAAVNFLIDELNADLNAKDSLGLTPIQVATLNGNLEAATILIDRRVLPNIKHEDDQKTLLHFAAESGSAAMFKFIVDQLKSMKSDLPQVKIHIDDADKHGGTALMCAIEGKLLVDEKPEESVPSNTQAMTYLPGQAQRIIEFFSGLRASANVGSVTNPSGSAKALGIDAGLVADHGNFAEEDSERYGSDELLIVEQILMSKANPNLIGGGVSFVLPCMRAAKYNRVRSLDLLLHHKADFTMGGIENDTALHVAALHGHYEACRFLTENGPDLLKLRNKLGETPLHLAARYGRHGIVVYFVEQLQLRYPGKWQEMLDAEDEKKFTPLMHAVLCGDAQVVRYLLSQGANPEPANAQGNSPLILAIIAHRLQYPQSNNDADCYSQWTECISTLLTTTAQDIIPGNKHKASANVCDTRNYPAIIAAASYGQTENVRVLLVCGAKHDVQHQRYGLLHWAVMGKVGSLVRMLLTEYQAQCGFNPNERAGPEGHTPLTLAVFQGHKGKEVVPALLENGAIVNYANGEGKVPFMVACKEHESEKWLLEMLRDYGADLSIPDPQGKVAIDYMKNTVNSDNYYQHMYQKKNDLPKNNGWAVLASNLEIVLARMIQKQQRDEAWKNVFTVVESLTTNRDLLMFLQWFRLVFRSVNVFQPLPLSNTNYFLSYVVTVQAPDFWKILTKKIIVRILQNMNVDSENNDLETRQAVFNSGLFLKDQTHLDLAIRVFTKEKIDFPAFIELAAKFECTIQPQTDISRTSTRGNSFSGNPSIYN